MTAQRNKKVQVNEREDWLLHIIDQTMGDLERQDIRMNPVIKDVLEYVHAHYADNLSIKFLSETF